MEKDEKTRQNKRIFAQLLRECLKRAELKQIDLAGEIDMSRSIISRTADPDLIYLASYENFQRIVEALKERPGNSQIQLEELEQAYFSALNPKKEISSGVPPHLINRLSQSLSRWPAETEEGGGIIKDIETTLSLWTLYDYAKNELDNGDPFRAKHSLVDILSQSGDRILLTVLALQDLAVCQRALNEGMETVLGNLNKALRMAKRHLQEIPSSTIGDLHTTKGDIHRRNGELRLSMNEYALASSFYAKIPDINERMKTLARIDRKMAGLNLYMGKPKVAEVLLYPSMRRSKKSNDISGIKKAQQHLAWARALQGYYDEALSIHKEHNSGFQVTTQRDYLELAKSQSYYGEILRMCGNYQEAQKIFQFSLDNLSNYAETILEEKESLIKGPIYVGLGQTLIALKRSEEANKILTDSLVINKYAPYFLARTHIALGKLNMLVDSVKAATHFQAADNLFSDLGNDYYVATILINRAQLEFYEKRYDEAHKWAREALKYSKENEGYTVHEIRANLWLGLIELAHPVESNALAWLQQCLSLCITPLQNSYLINEAIEQLYTWESRFVDFSSKDISFFLIDQFSSHPYGTETEFGKYLLEKVLFLRTFVNKP